jgi:putative PIN family toxin of toxin-antitoxin system
LKVVFDTQVYIRALQPNAYPTEAALFRLWVEKSRFELYTSQTQIEEIRRVSRRKIAQARIGKAKFGALITLLKAKATVLKIPAREVAEVVAADPTDDFIVAIAVKAGAEILVSDDKHLKPLKSVGKTRILTPLEVLRKLRM